MPLLHPPIRQNASVMSEHTEYLHLDPDVDKWTLEQLRAYVKFHKQQTTHTSRKVLTEERDTTVSSARALPLRPPDGPSKDEETCPTCGSDEPAYCCCKWSSAQRHPHQPVVHCGNQWHQRYTVRSVDDLARVVFREVRLPTRGEVLVPLSRALQAERERDQARESAEHQGKSTALWVDRYYELLREYREAHGERYRELRRSRDTYEKHSKTVRAQLSEAKEALRWSYNALRAIEAVGSKSRDGDHEIRVELTETARRARDDASRALSSLEGDA